MRPLVIDASVAVKWFLPENHTSEALLIRDKFVDGECKLIAGPDAERASEGTVEEA